VHDESELVVGSAGGPEFGELFLDPLGDSSIARDLCRPVAVQKLGCVRRLVGIVGSIDGDGGSSESN
jgi:hypothetical protein